MNTGLYDSKNPALSISRLPSNIFTWTDVCVLVQDLLQMLAWNLFSPSKIKTYKHTWETQQLELDCPKNPEYVQFQKRSFHPDIETRDGLTVSLCIVKADGALCGS